MRPGRRPVSLRRLSKPNHAHDRSNLIRRPFGKNGKRIRSGKADATRPRDGRDVTAEATVDGRSGEAETNEQYEWWTAAAESAAGRDGEASRAGYGERVREAISATTTATTKYGPSVATGTRNDGRATSERRDDDERKKRSWFDDASADDGDANATATTTTGLGRGVCARARTTTTTTTTTTTKNDDGE